MNNFDFYNPVRVRFGAGQLESVGEIAHKAGQCACIVSYRELGPLKPVCDKVEKILKEKGISVFTFYKADPNPDIKTIGEGADFCREHNVDFVIGIGGGSAMDAAKSVAAGVYYQGDLWNMVYSRHHDVTAVPPEKALPTIMIPTLPATGSEMNQCSVASNRELKEKSYIWAECLYPTWAIIDPELTLTLPAYQSACAAADSISHVLEIYINGEENSPLQHSFQEGIIRTIIDNIRIALKSPADIDARANLQWAATCAINGWASPGDAWTPLHQVAHNLTSLFGVAHGASLSALMPAWMKTFSGRRNKRYFDFAVNVMNINPDGKSTEQVISDGIEAFEAFLVEIEVPTSLSDLKLKADCIPSIIDGVRKVSFNDEGVLACNPSVSADDLILMLENAKPAEA